MRKILLTCMLLAVACELRAQGSATVHVFPQIADGLDSAATGYFSTVLVTNTSNAPSTCTIQLFGSGLANRLAGPSTATLQGQGSFASISTTLSTGSLLPLVTGYATLTCTQPVAASVLYVYASLSGVQAGATVFSSPSATRAQLLSIANARLAFAIANNTDAAAQYQLTLVNSAGQTVSTGTVSVGARSSLPRFIDQVMTVPADFTGALVVTGSTPFNLMGLFFSGIVFTSQPPAILAQ